MPNILDARNQPPMTKPHDNICNINLIRCQIYWTQEIDYLKKHHDNLLDINLLRCQIYWRQEISTSILSSLKRFSSFSAAFSAEHMQRKNRFWDSKICKYQKSDKIKIFKTQISFQILREKSHKNSPVLSSGPSLTGCGFKSIFQSLDSN